MAARQMPAAPSLTPTVAPAIRPATSARGWTILVLVGGALGAIAAFMPWATASAGVFSVSKDGIDGDGQITVIVGIVAALVGALPLMRSATLSRGGAVFAFILGLIVAGVGVYDFVDVSNEPGDIIEPASGLYLTVIAGALVLLGSAVAIKRSSADATAA